MLYDNLLYFLIVEKDLSIKSIILVSSGVKVAYNFSLAFSLAKKLKEYNGGLDVSILFEVVDTAPSETEIINGISYQYDLKDTEKMNKSMNDFVEILDYFSKKDNVLYQIRNQSGFNSQESIKNIINTVIRICVIYLLKRGV